MKKENQKQLEISLLKNIYKNLEDELKELGTVKFVENDFSTQIEIEDNLNDNLIFISFKDFKDNKLQIIATYQIDYDWEFNSSDAKKLIDNGYNFSIFKGKFIINKILTDSNEILGEIKNNIYRNF